MKFIVLEGLDGSGKSTQIELLQNYFSNNNIKFKYLHFPRTDAPIFGELISMFLRGDLGNIEQVNPYLVALIYAEDRNNAKVQIREWLADGYLVLVDRYVYSNIAFQGAKTSSEKEMIKLKDWIMNLEFNHFDLPKPDISILLSVPFEFTAKKLSGNRTGDDRNYLMGKKDIHEQDLDFQKRVKEVYLKAVEKDEKFRLINCCTSENEMKKPDEIFSNILSTLKTEKIL